MVRKKLLLAVSLLPLPGKPNLQISPAARPSYAAARALSIQVFWYGLTDSRSRNGPLRIETQLGLAALPLGNCHENGESAHHRETAKGLRPHVADRYCNSMRYFGILAPRSRNLLSVVFDLLHQKQRPQPAPLPWATSLARTFGVNPLIGRDGSVLRRVGSIKPSAGI